MTEEQAYLSIPGHVPVKIAATILHLSEERVLQHIRSRRLPARKIGGRYLIPRSALEGFQRPPHGRTRTTPVPWRQYRAGARVYILHISVPIRCGQEHVFTDKVRDMSHTQRHLFPGTMSRYICQERSNPRQVDIYLLWKDTELRDEAELQGDVARFQAAFADCLDWGAHASSARSEVVTYT